MAKALYSSYVSPLCIEPVQQRRPVMNKRTRAGPLPASIFAGVVRSVQEKNQLFLAFIPRMTTGTCADGWCLLNPSTESVNKLLNIYNPVCHPRSVMPCYDLLCTAMKCCFLLCLCYVYAMILLYIAMPWRCFAVLLRCFAMPGQFHATPDYPMMGFRISASSSATEKPAALACPPPPCRAAMAETSTVPGLERKLKYRRPFCWCQMMQNG